MDMVGAKKNELFDTFTHSTVVSKDRTIIGYQSIGKGPSLIVIHGALFSIKSTPTNWDWLPEYENDMNKKDFRGAFASFVRGAGHTPFKKVTKMVCKIYFTFGDTRKSLESNKETIA
jgi:hypothetical protein